MKDEGVIIMAGRHAASTAPPSAHEVRAALAATREREYALGWWDGYEGWRPVTLHSTQYTWGYLEGREASLQFPRSWGAETHPRAERLALRVA